MSEDERFNLYVSEPILVTVKPDEERQIGGKKIALTPTMTQEIYYQ